MSDLKSGKKKRILFITNDYPPRIGGQSRLSEYLVTALQQRFDVSVFLNQRMAPEQSYVSSLFEKTGEKTLMNTISLKIRRFIFVTRALSIVNRLGRDFDLVIGADGGVATVLALYVSLLLGKPFINHCHGRDFSWRIFTPLEHSLFKRTRLTLASSQYTKEKFEQRGLTRNAVVLYPAVSLQDYRVIPAGQNFLYDIYKTDQRKVVLTVCRLTPRKGIEVVLHALSKVKWNFLYLIIGDEGDPAVNERQKLEILAEKLGIHKKVVFLGSVSDQQLPYYYNFCDFFVMTPYDIFNVEEGRHDYEGFGMVYLEASACGKPVIGSRSGGVPEAIQENGSGLLVNPKDIEQLTEAMNRLALDEDLRKKLSAGSLEWVKNFENARFSKQYLEAVEGVFKT